MPDCWLEVSKHLGGPVTGQLDKGFPWISSVLRANAELVPKFHVALQAYHAAETSKFRPRQQHMLPSLGLVCEFGVLIECSGTLLNFSPCSTFHLYLLLNVLPPLHPTFTKRTSGDCWGPS
jgi:hypothetical protein